MIRQDNPIAQEKSSHKGSFLVNEERLFPKDLVGHWILKEKYYAIFGLNLTFMKNMCLYPIEFI